MTDLRKAAEMALEALENVPIEYDFHGNPMDSDFGKQLDTAVEALRQALTQPEQEPVVWMCRGIYSVTGYCPKPKREWVGLTDEDRFELSDKVGFGLTDEDFELIEAKLKEKNT